MLKKLKENLDYRFRRFLDTKLGGHKSIGKLTVYGHNAMHWGVTYHTKKYGYICFRLPLPCHGWKALYFYLSPNATPWAATFMLGRKHSKRDWALARVRKTRLGHNFSTDVYHAQLTEINNIL